MTNYNLAFLESIALFKNKECTIYRWRDAIKRFWWDSEFHNSSTPAGFYDCFHLLMSEAELNKIGIRTLDEELYYKPYIILTFASGRTKEIICETIPEAEGKKKAIIAMFKLHVPNGFLTDL